ncbi:hypothetical protein [Parasphingopyxis sp.]|uniref:hypothetical protein n=1 Tax=Parasphingopyxis sp. TaxID=1920299 RepID=UPI0026380945|nr:hypothetical protein [Parasphingopyxis sp.]
MTDIEQAREIAILLDDKCHRGSSEDGMWKNGYRAGHYDEGATMKRALAALRATPDAGLREAATGARNWIEKVVDADDCPDGGMRWLIALDDALAASPPPLDMGEVIEALERLAKLKGEG